MAMNWRGKRILKFGTWNVRGLSGKEVELVNELNKAGVQISAITETKKKGTGCEEMNDGSMLFYSGVPIASRAKAGVAIYVVKDLVKNVKDWKFINERIIKVQFTNLGIIKDLNLIAAYGHNEDETSETRNEFFETLQKVIDDSSGEVLIMGDLNGKVGNCPVGYEDVIGSHGEPTRTNNGKLILQLCSANGLMVHNTRYPHKDIHKWTRTEPQLNQKLIIDYIIGSKSTCGYVRDARVMRGPEIGSDHHLLVMKRVIEGAQRKRKGRKQKKINEKIKINELKKEEKMKEYEKKVSEEIAKLDLEEDQDLEMVWLTFKRIVLSAAEEICGKVKCGTVRKKTRWWTGELMEAVKKKKEKWRRYLQTQDGRDYEVYKNVRSNVKTLVRESKKKAWQEFGEFLEQSYSENQKLFYKVLKNLRKAKECPLKFVRDKNGNLLTDKGKIMERWREHFSELLGGGAQAVEEIRPTGKSDDSEDGMITEEEMKRALTKLKMGKAGGADGIAPELLRNMGAQGERLLYKLLCKAWRTKEIPKDWETAVIIPLFKKGDNRECGNHRGISLLSVAGKVYSRILEERLRAEVEPLLDEVQCGFRPNRSTQDLIFTARQLMEKTIEFDKEAHLCFIDLQKAFDSVPWGSVWTSLENRGVSNNLVERIRSFYRNCRSFIRTANCSSQEFLTNIGVRQGDILSPLLFVVVMDDAIKACKARSGRGYHLGYWLMERVYLWCMAFADDLVLVAESAVKLQELLDIWVEELSLRGLSINVAKTKTMVVARQQKTHQINIHSEALEQVSSFKYLGVTVTSDGKCKQELESRIAATGRLFHAMNRGFISKTEVAEKTKITVFKTVYLPTLTYGCESWAITQKSKSRIQATEMRFLRRVAGYTRRDRVRNTTIRLGLGVQPALRTVERAQLRWFGHVHRMGNERLPRRALEARSDGRRPRGRRRTTWMDNITSTLGQFGVTVQGARNLCQDRKAWRSFLASSTPHGRRGTE